MHLQLFHALEFRIASLKKSNRPKSIKSFRSIKSKNILRNCLVVFISVEVNDQINNTEKAILEIKKVFEQIRIKNNKRYKKNPCSSIILVPYSHQRNIETDSNKAYSIIHSVYKLMTSKIPDVNIFLGDFGFKNTWSIKVKGHDLACLYRQA